MNLVEIQKLIKVTKKFSPNCFVNASFEFIVEPRNNIFFRLEDVESEFDLKRKVISWLSRPSCKGVSLHWQKKIRSIVNEYLGTDFSEDDMREIYTYLGNDCNRPKCIAFIESNYDLSILPKAIATTEPPSESGSRIRSEQVILEE